MSKEKKKSVLEEAVIDMNTIVEAATKKAKDKLASEMPEKFENFLSEELDKNNKESVKESKEDKSKEPVSEGNQKTDDNKESLNEMDEMDMRDMSIGEVEEAYDEANPEDEFEVELTIDDIADELGGAEETEEVVEGQPTEESDPYGKIKQLYEMMSEMIKEMDEAKVYNEMQDKFNESMVEMYGEGYKETMDEGMHDKMFEMFVARQKGDPFEKNGTVNESTIVEANHEEDGEGENINEAVSPELLQSAAGVLGVVTASGGIAALQNYLKTKHPKAAAALEKLGGAAGTSIRGEGVVEMTEGDDVVPVDDTMNESAMAMSPELLQAAGGMLGVLAASGGIAALQNYLKTKNPKLAAALEQLGGVAGTSIRGEGMEEGVVDGELDREGMDSFIAKLQKNGMAELAAEVEREKTKMFGAPAMAEGEEKEEIKEESDEDRKEEETIDEIHGQSFSAGKVRAGSLPNDGGEYRDRNGHSRNRPEWSNESVDKKVASLIEENKKVTKELQEAVKANSKYKEHLEKYRGQLQEMAVVNTNIAHVNDILIKESEIPSERVETIIDNFKTIESITESEETYKNVLSEMTEEKETLDESIEKKIIDTVGQSSSTKITEQVVEKTAFGSKHLNEIKRRMDYMVSK